MLENNSYEVKVQNVMTEDIDPEADMIVIFAPSTDYTEEAAQKVEKFLSNDGDMGKSAVYFVNVEKEDTPNLDSLLSNGISQ